MSPRSTNALRSATALVLLLVCTWIVEIALLPLASRDSILAPYGFFPNQAYDWFAKLAWWLRDSLPVASSLPDRFVAPELVAKAAALRALLPATLPIAAALAIGGSALATASRKPRTVRGYLLAWTLLALTVHAAAALPALGLDEGIRLSHLAYRGRSLFVDGTLLSVGICLLAAGLARAAAPRVESPRSSLALCVLAFAAAAIASIESPVVDDAAGPKPASEARAQNVLLISLDSLRADHVGAYGYVRDTSPHFDRLAREGTLFRNAVATSSWTLPTHLTMFTGRYQVSHGVVEDTRVLAPSIPILGEIFRGAGFATAGFVSGPYLAGHYGYERGMDTYVDLSAEWGKGPEARTAILSPAINERALAWLDEHSSERFFLFLHYFDIHYDYIPPPPYDTMFDPDYTGTMDGHRFIERDDVHPGMDPRDLDHIRALYDGEIRFTDEHVGRILERLRSLGVLDSTIVMIVSDHGDEFFEHGNKGHHRTVYDEVLRIPFAMRLPGVVPAATTVEEQVSLVDVFPTLLDAAGLAIPGDVEGTSLLGAGHGERDAVYAEFYDKRGFNLQVARRTPARKTIQHFSRITHPTRGAIEHYDLADDPGERDNRAEDLPEEARAALDRTAEWLDGRWQASRRAEAAAGGRASIDIDEETMERLKSLGYVGD